MVRPMGLLRNATAVVFQLAGFAALFALPAAWAQTPQSQCSVLSGRPCHPSFCGVFHRGPCLPYYLPPIGEDLRLTIVSTDDSAAECWIDTGGVAFGAQQNLVEIAEVYVSDTNVSADTACQLGTTLATAVWPKLPTTS